MAERRIPYPIIWLMFLASLFVGAGMLLSSDGRLQAVGLALFFLPLVAFSLLMALYYWRSRRMEKSA